MNLVKIVALAGIAGIVIGIVGIRLPNAQDVRRNRNPISQVVARDAGVPVPEISGYHDWKHVNDKPQFIMSRLDLLCRSPFPEEIAAEKLDPHVRHYMLCYVNAIGEHAMFSEKHPRFPVGSVVLKEKRDSENPKSQCMLVTAMIKRTSGYDPVHGDWEYVVLSGDAGTLQARGKLENCGGCHAQKRSNDYVFRDELGEKKLALLR